MNLNFALVVGPELFVMFAMSLDQFSPACVAVRGTLVGLIMDDDQGLEQWSL
jgi:hypothetical protein